MKTCGRSRKVRNGYRGRMEDKAELAGKMELAGKNQERGMRCRLFVFFSFTLRLPFRQEKSFFFF
jgi:hypothetical protein